MISSGTSAYPSLGSLKNLPTLTELLVGHIVAFLPYFFNEKIITEFCAKFACCFLAKEERKNKDEKKNGHVNEEGQEQESAEASKSSETEEDDELPLFMYRLFTWLLDHHEVRSRQQRHSLPIDPYLCRLLVAMLG